MSVVQVWYLENYGNVFCLPIDHSLDLDKMDVIVALIQMDIQVCFCKRPVWDGGIAPDLAT